MTEDRDPMLQSLFADAERTTEDETFVARVIVEIDRVQRRAFAIRIGIGVLFVMCAWLLSGPLHTAVHLLNRLLFTPIFDLDSALLSDMLLPVNSVALVLVLGLFGLRLVYKRIFLSRSRI